MKSTILQLVAVSAFASAFMADSVEPEIIKIERERMGLVRIVGTLETLESGYSPNIVVEPESKGYWAEIVTIPRQGKNTDRFDEKYNGLTVEVIGYYNSFRNHERNRDVHIGEVTILKHWRVVEPTSPRGIWQLFNGERIFPPKTRPKTAPLPELHIPGLLED